MKSQRPELILIAGLNNNDVALEALAEVLRVKGYVCHLLNLPGQGEDRLESKTFETAMAVFDRKMRSVVSPRYSVIAFSTGALYVNLWLARNPEMKPQCEILLSPAFLLRNARILTRLFGVLPGEFGIRSLAPSKFRRYDWMKAREYMLLFSLVSRFESAGSLVPVPFRIFVDARDELVDAQAVKEKFPEDTSLLRRPVGKVAPGMFHAIFHPDFWKESAWNAFVDDLTAFLEKHS